jgi:hypothetical protein
MLYYLSPPLYTCFEHKSVLGGGSGDGGDVLLY